MTKISLQWLDISDVEWQVGHLFEHLVIRCFFEELKKTEHEPELAGWIDGEAFEDRVFLDAGFYDVKIHGLFLSYLNSLPVFSLDEIKKELLVMECEDYVKINISDQNKLHHELEKLSHRQWNTVIANPPTSRDAPPILTVKRDKKAFRDLSIIVHSSGLTDNEQKLFLRFRTIFTDMLNVYMRENIKSIYIHGYSATALRDHDMAYMSQITLPRGGATLPMLRSLLDGWLHKIDFDQLMPGIRVHFEAYKNNDLLQRIAIDYYRDTGITTTTEEIASLATYENITSLCSKIKIYIRDSSATDKEQIL